MTPRRPTGFSLIELVLVLAILTVVAAIAAPRVGEASLRRRLDGAAHRIAAELVDARLDAQAASRSRVIAVDILEHSISIAEPDYTILRTIELDDEPYRAGIASYLLGGDPAIVFDAYGVPDTTGRIVIRASGQTRRVLVDAAGNVTVVSP